MILGEHKWSIGPAEIVIQRNRQYVDKRPGGHFLLIYQHSQTRATLYKTTIKLWEMGAMRMVVLYLLNIN